VSRFINLIELLGGGKGVMFFGERQRVGEVNLRKGERAGEVLEKKKET